MHHLNQKSLAFYGIAISAVVILFRGVTWYGTNYLKAAKTIQGAYHLTLTSPPCASTDSLVLTLQQSGKYLGGQLQPMVSGHLPDPAADLTLTLKGKWSEPQLQLQGQTSQITICGRALATVAMVATYQGDGLEGQLTSSGLPGSVAFKARPLAP